MHIHGIVGNTVNEQIKEKQLKSYFSFHENILTSISEILLLFS